MPNHLKPSSAAFWHLPIDLYKQHVNLTMKKILSKIPTSTLVIISLLLGMAPFSPEPHLWEKLKMLFDGSLAKPIDIFDLFMHGTPVILLGLKLIFSALDKSDDIQN